MQPVPPISEGDNQLGRTEETKMVNDEGLFFLQKKKKKESLQRMNKWGCHLTFCLEKALPVLHSPAFPGIDHPYSGTRGSCEL